MGEFGCGQIWSWASLDVGEFRRGRIKSWVVISILLGGGGGTVKKVIHNTLNCVLRRCEIETRQSESIQAGM